jgi:hypothetical protein
VALAEAAAVGAEDHRDVGELRHREIQRLGADRRQRPGQRVAGEKRREQGGGGVGQRAARIEVGDVKPRHRLRHVQAAIGSEPGGDGLAQAGGRTAAAGADVTQGAHQCPA